MRILIRKATPADLETLLRFEQGVVQAERPFDPTLKDGKIHYYDIPAMLTSDEVEFVVATAGTRLIGCGFARIEPAKPFLTHARHAYLGLMYVEPEFRGAGVNGRILDALQDWCRSRSVVELRLEVYHGNDSALRAYEKAGFTPLYIQMRSQLPDG